MDLESGERFQSLVHFEGTMPAGAQRVHGLSASDLTGQPSMA